MDVIGYISENKERLKAVPYDPYTGEGCCGKRRRHRLTGVDKDLYLPEEAMKDKLIKVIVKHGGLPETLRAAGMEDSPDNINELYIAFCEARYYYDFEYYAACMVTITDKDSGREIPFRLNSGQRYLLRSLEDQRAQKKPIRIIHLKPRQFGGSTLIQQYMNWIQIIKKRNWNSVICAHTRDSAINIRSIYELSLDKMPPIGGVKMHAMAFKSTQNIKIVPERGCRTTVGTAQEPDSVRSQDAKLAHFSEVAYYPNTDKIRTDALISSIISTIPRVPYSLVAYESTANGVGDFFHKEWQKACKGLSAFVPVFVPWFIIERYRVPFNGSYYLPSGRLTAGDIKDFILSLDDYEKELFQRGSTLEGINWYRSKLAEMTSPEQMRQEFPSYPDEAFLTTGMPVFRREDILRAKENCSNAIALGDMASKTSASYAKVHPEKRREVLQNVSFIEDASLQLRYQSSDTRSRYLALRNKLRIWEYPDNSYKIRDRYVVSVDTGGRGEKADFSCVTVLDRYWMMYGEGPSVVARWKGHTDHDLLVWLSAQIAEYYNHALLVFESNTEETESRDGDSEEFIFDILSDYYDNLYSRTPADKIKEGAPAVWGFHTNKKTKTMIIDEYISILRDGLYTEVDEECLDEALLYEKKPNGKFGARDGYHDDILMSTMIGLYICYRLDTPRIIEDRPRSVRRNSDGMVI